jgi:pimeloyl-ACP methyl ester carboxylesterase
LIVPGMGTPRLVWTHVFERFHEKMTMVTWDQRGCYASDSPLRREQLAFDYHVEDAFAVLDHLGWTEDYVTGSWSMGVQLGLELFARRMKQVKALTLINGAFEHVLHTAYGPPQTTPLIRAALRGAIRAAPLTATVTRRLLESGRAGYLMDRLRVSTNNVEFVTAVTKELAKLDFANYLTILLELDKHSGRSVLPRVNVPTLITAGEKDVATPPAVAEELRRGIPHAEYVLIENGTHYTPLEYPERLNDALDGFFGRVFGADW